INNRGNQRGQFRGREQPNEEPRTCWFCNEPGHIRFNCPEMKKLLQERKESKKEQPAVRADKQKENNEFVSAYEVSTFCVNDHDEDDDGLLLDSGTTHQMMPSLQNICNIRPIGGRVRLASEQSCDVVCVGDYVTRNLKLSDVKIVPALRSGLVSVSKLCDKGYDVLFTKAGAS